MNDVPNFAAWSLENLAKFAAEAYVRMQSQECALAQARLDLRDAMQLARKTYKQEIPFHNESTL
jgi:hypothetical protein